MGKIFGISDLPVTIFTTPLQPVELPSPKVSDLADLSIRKKVFSDIGADIFINQKDINVVKHTVREIIK